VASTHVLGASGLPAGVGAEVVCPAPWSSRVPSASALVRGRCFRAGAQRPQTPPGGGGGGVYERNLRAAKLSPSNRLTMSR